jgi:epoxyqueuosine reductase
METRESHFAARTLPDLRVMLGWSDAEFRSRFRGTPIFRLKSPRWRRNICVVLGNIGTEEDVPALKQAADGGEPLVREHALWALERIRARKSAPGS